MGLRKKGETLTVTIQQQVEVFFELSNAVSAQPSPRVLPREAGKRLRIGGVAEEDM